MIKFISENCFVCISLLYILAAVVLYLKFKSADKKMFSEKNIKFSEITVLQRQKFMLKSRMVNVLLVLLTVIFAAVIICRFFEHFETLAAVVFAVLSAIAASFVFFELILFMSAVLRKIIAIKSIALNTLLSAVIISLTIMGINLAMRYKGISVESFVLAEICLAVCYIVLLVILILVLKEANDENSKLTPKNMWKSAMLTITLFLLNLSMMSSYCLSFSEKSINGANGVFDMFYYTVITFATVGYGDIVPVSPFAKAVSMLTVITSILCITVLLSELVSIRKKQ